MIIDNDSTMCTEAEKDDETTVVNTDVDSKIVGNNEESTSVKKPAFDFWM